MLSEYAIHQLKTFRLADLEISEAVGNEKQAVLMDCL